MFGLLRTIAQRSVQLSSALIPAPCRLLSSLHITYKPTHKCSLLMAGLSLVPVRGFKVRSAVKKRCKDCYCVRRDGVLFVRCKSHARHHQRQGRSRSQAP